MEKTQLLFLDFEFSMPEGRGNPPGFFPEIIEVGAAAVENERVVDSFSSFVKPMFYPSISERCKQFLGVQQQDVDRGISFVVLVNRLALYQKEGFQTVVTWGNADEKVLKDNCAHHQLVYPFSKPMIDLSLEYKRFFGDRNQTGLRKAVESYGKKGVGNHHRALDDALTTYEIYKLVQQDKQYMNKPKLATIGERIDWEKLKKMTLS
ncbi:MAG: 3'-5' exonuclease KapD [Bacillaceae bacterium]